jgi:hypothetical protein
MPAPRERLMQPPADQRLVVDNQNERHLCGEAL